MGSNRAIGDIYSSDLLGAELTFVSGSLDAAQQDRPAPEPWRLLTAEHMPRAQICKSQTVRKQRPCEYGYTTIDDMIAPNGIRKFTESIRFGVRDCTDATPKDEGVIARNWDAVPIR